AGQNDTFLGNPPWEFGRSVTPSAWVYGLTIVGGTSLEPQDALAIKLKDETIAWVDTNTATNTMDYSRLGITGTDDLPDPVHMPAVPVKIFDAREKVASEAGIEVLCDLLKDPLEVQKQAAAEVLLPVLLRKVVDPGMALGCLEPPVGEDGIDQHTRMELIKFLVKQHRESEVTEGRAPIVVHQLLVLISQQQNVQCLAHPSVGAVDTFFRYLTAGFTTVIRTQELMIRLLSGRDPALRQLWAAEMCQGENIQKLMQQIIRRKDDRRISAQYRTLLSFVLQQCNQKKLMTTVCEIREDDISIEEQLLVARILYSCLSAVSPSLSTKPIQPPKPLKKARANDTGLGEIMKLRVPGAPGMVIRVVPQQGRTIGGDAGGVTMIMEWKEEPIVVDPNEIIIWIAKTESALQQPVHLREGCKMILAHTRPLRSELAETEKQKMEDEELFDQRYQNQTSEPLEVFQLDFHDTVYYQLQFMGGSDLDPFLDKEDIEMVADEPPKVVVQAITEGMVTKEVSEGRYQANTAFAFDKPAGANESIIEYVLRIVEDIEGRLRKELEGGSDRSQGESDLSEDMTDVMLKEDPTQICRFMNRLLKWTRLARVQPGGKLDVLGDGQVAADGQDIDAAATKKDPDLSKFVASMSYLRMSEELRPIQRLLGLTVLSVSQQQQQRLTESMSRVLALVDSYDATVAQSMCDSVLQLLYLPRNVQKFSRANVEKVLQSMTQAFSAPEKAESSLLSFTNILTKWLKPELKDVDQSSEPASSRIITPLLDILQKSDTTQDQRAFIFNVIRQGMRYEIVSTVSFTGSSGKKGKAGKSGASQQFLQVLRPLGKSVDRMRELTDYHDLFRDLAVASSSASVLKKVCLVSDPKGHSMLIAQDVVPKLMRVIGEIKDFLPRFADAKQNFELETPSFCIDTQTRTVTSSKYLLL
ncbi:unnamed protein product, partial [Polarella glacialis]